MNLKSFQSLTNNLIAECKGIQDSKRDEYTNTSDDVLNNFKRVAERAGLKPLQVWLVYFLKHVDSIQNFVKTGHGGSEGIESRFQDAINYLFLGYGLLEEIKQEEAHFDRILYGEDLHD